MDQFNDILVYHNSKTIIIVLTYRFDEKIDVRWLHVAAVNNFESCSHQRKGVSRTMCVAQFHYGKFTVYEQHRTPGTPLRTHKSHSEHLDGLYRYGTGMDANTGTIPVRNIMHAHVR